MCKANSGTVSPPVTFITTCRIKVFTAADHTPELHTTVISLPVPVIADHQGGMKGTSALPAGMIPTTQPGLRSLISLARCGKVYIKISGLYRSSKLKDGSRGGYEDINSVLQVFAREVPDRLIWGSDWPHTGSGKDRIGRDKETLEPFRSVDNEAIMKNINQVFGETLWKRMTVETPSRAFGH
jgi:predicted TIM-barrel fold metal-dependent hydrolase